MKHLKIWTIGHSTRSIGEFVDILKKFNIKVLADVRRFPGSRKFPHFNKEFLSEKLNEHHIGYLHIPELGGRRKAQKDSKNSAWRNEAFRGYADYMQTKDFENGIEHLAGIAETAPTAYMCSEAVWWRCHRSLISDYLKSKGWEVMHIMDLNKVQEHPYTSAARIVEGKLDYGGNSQLNIDY
jgi:uncharacterized protein (DUF488 family)